MTVGELKEALEYFNPDSEIRWAAQPSWPFEYSISSAEEVENEEEEDENGEFVPEEDRKKIVYLVEGSQLGYLPSYVEKAIGWK